MKQNYNILLDMDDVIVDFAGGYLNFHGKNIKEYPIGNPDIMKFLKIQDDDKWNNIDESFWSNLNPTKDFNKLIKYFDENKFIPNNLCIVSSHSGRPEIAAGKIKWLKNYLPGIKYSLTQYKHFYACNKNILIDDYEKNCNIFKDNGGHSIVVPTITNSLYKYKDYSYDFVISRLEEIIKMGDY